MTDDAPTSTLPRPNGEGAGMVRAVRTDDDIPAWLRQFLLSRRRALIGELEELNRTLGIEKNSGSASSRSR